MEKFLFAIELIIQRNTLILGIDGNSLYIYCIVSLKIGFKGMVVLKRRDARCLLLALWEDCFICEVIFDERVIILVEVVMSEQHLEYVLAINVDVLLIKEELIVAHRAVL